MANEIKINKDFKLNLNFETQISPLGRPMRFSGIEMIKERWEKVSNKNKLIHNCIYTFVFLDEKGGFISFEFDYLENYVCKIKK